MTDLLDLSNNTYRDFRISGVPASGANEPAKSEIRTLFSQVILAIQASVAGLSSYSTLALAQAADATEPGTQARVYNDPVPGNNGVYVNRSGAAGGYVFDTDFYNQLATVVQPQIDTVVSAAQAASAAAGRASPFQLDATFTGPLSAAQWKGFLIDVDLSDWPDYNPARFYSFAEVNKTASMVVLRLYEQTAPGSYVFPPKITFILDVAGGYDPGSKDILIIKGAGGFGKVAIVPDALPNLGADASGMDYQIAGLDDHVFRKGYGLLARAAGLDFDSLVTADPATFAMRGAYASNVAYLHPNEPAEGLGDSNFTNATGLGQWYQFEQGAVVQRIETGMFSPLAAFKGKVIVKKLTNTTNLDPVTAGVLLQEFVYPEDAHLGDFSAELINPTFFKKGEIIAVYVVPDSGFSVRMRYWDSPRLGEPNPNNRKGLIFRSSTGGVWAFGSVAADSAYYQTPLRLYTNIVSREEVREMLGKVVNETTTPRLVLPSKVYAVVGRELNLYYDAMALMPEVGLGIPQFLFDVVCDIGTSYKRGYRVTPTAPQVGNHSLTVIAYNGRGDVIEAATTTLVVMAAANPGSVKRIVCIGDSTTDDSGVVTQTLQSNLASLGGNVPLFIGSHGTSPYNMEARSGMTFGYYAYGGNLRFKFTVTGFPSVPFWPIWTFTGQDGTGNILAYEEAQITAGSGWVIGVVNAYPAGQVITDGWTGQLKLNGATFNVTATVAQPGYSIFKTNGTGALSFANYMSRMGYAGCDLLSMDLGINDSRGGVQSETDQLYKINAAKAVITSYLAYNPAGKVIVCLPKSGASTINNPATGATNHDSYRINIHRLRELIIEHFDLNAFGPNVAVCASGLTVDRYYGYPLLDAVSVAARFAGTYTETIHADFVHPQPEGSRQCGDGMTGSVLAALV